VDSRPDYGKAQERLGGENSLNQNQKTKGQDENTYRRGKGKSMG